MTFPTYRLRRALIGLLGVVLAACSALPQGSIQTPPIATAPTGEPSPTAPGYVLAVGDEVELRFADRPDMIHTLRVQPDGQVSPPYLPPQPAVGRTVAEVAQGVRAELAKLADGGAQPASRMARARPQAAHPALAPSAAAPAKSALPAQKAKQLEHA